MTRSIAMNDNYDIYKDSQGNLAIVTGAQATLQNSISAMSAQRGEMIYAIERGIPTRQLVWDSFDPAQYEAAARETLLRVEGVTGVESFNVIQVGDEVKYTATLLTVYGAIELGNL